MLERLHRLGYTSERNPWSVLLEDLGSAANRADEQDASGSRKTKGSSLCSGASRTTTLISKGPLRRTVWVIICLIQTTSTRKPVSSSSTELPADHQRDHLPSSFRDALTPSGHGVSSSAPARPAAGTGRAGSGPLRHSGRSGLVQKPPGAAGPGRGKPLDCAPWRARVRPVRARASGGGCHCGKWTRRGRGRSWPRRAGSAWRACWTCSAFHGVYSRSR